uniref:(northern house mosquito) hypothetical protein n=1 Tax=Culex pipiens TaxID=7175 RepID=A0A8D8F5D7_CULPI
MLKKQRLPNRSSFTSGECCDIISKTASSTYVIPAASKRSRFGKILATSSRSRGSASTIFSERTLELVESTSSDLLKYSFSLSSTWINDFSRARSDSRGREQNSRVSLDTLVP